MPKQILFRVDGSERIGGGHVMRCLALADALAARGARTGFVCAALTPSLADKVRAAGHALVRIEDSPRNGSDLPGWDSTSLPPDAQRDDAARTANAFGGTRLDWLVVDHYRLDHHWAGAMRAQTHAIMVIDDLANRRHDCDLLLDQTFGRAAADYRALVPDHCDLLLGASYAPLRPEFAALRAAALVRRAEAARPVGRVLISLGTMDLGGVTARVLPAVRAACPDSAIDVVIGASAPSLAAVEDAARGDHRIVLHRDPPDMAALMLAADLGVGAAGTTSWERCCLGLPALVLVLAENQRFVADQLDRAGAHRALSDEGGGLFQSALEALAQDPAARHRMSEAAFAITDGLGSARICAAMLGKPDEV